MNHRPRTSTTIENRLKQVKTRFVLTIVVLSTVSVCALAISLYATSAVRFSGDISPEKIGSLVENYPAVADYLAQQKEYEAHFITLSNLVKNDQQRLLGGALAYIALPVLAVTALVSFIVAHRLLRPIKESFESQEQFLQDAAHELRNPLAALYAVVQEAKAQQGRSTSASVVDTIERQVKQIVKLNEDLLTLEKAKTVTPNAPSTNISELTYDVIDGLTYKANSAKVQIKTRISPNIHANIRDEDWVCICNNLIDNAIKYSTKKGVVQIKLETNKSRVLLSVTDFGIGIPKEEISKVGGRFFRATNSGRITGTGLGLAIVMQIASVYKGSFNVDSEQGRGTTASVELPLRSLTTKVRNAL